MSSALPLLDLSSDRFEFLQCILSLRALRGLVKELSIESADSQRVHLLDELPDIPVEGPSDFFFYLLFKFREDQLLCLTHTKRPLQHPSEFLGIQQPAYSRDSRPVLSFIFATFAIFGRPRNIPEKQVRQCHELCLPRRGNLRGEGRERVAQARQAVGIRFPRVFQRLGQNRGSARATLAASLGFMRAARAASALPKLDRRSESISCEFSSALAKPVRPRLRRR